MTQDTLNLAGFGNQFQTEAIQGALPVGQNSPQKPAFGLYAEQINGSAFTAPRHDNFRSWLYRIQPSVVHGEYKPYKHPTMQAKYTQRVTTPEQLRWSPPPMPKSATDFIDGWLPFAENRAAKIYLFCINQSMQERYFYNADGEMLIVAQQGTLRFKTEMGILEVKPNEIIVIPRGIKFQVECLDEQARGYICENNTALFTLPNLGPIGANGLANPRDFIYPSAAFEQKSQACDLIIKFSHQYWRVDMDHSPLDVVAWHGNYAPYKYDLTRFNTINTVSFDHPDPSIFTVLTSQSPYHGTANIDFVIFPNRWMVAEHTFRPPYYHRNLMSEFMGSIKGVYDAKEDGFMPGGCSLHNCMSPHGPDAAAFEKATFADLKPQQYRNTLAFMFESRMVWHPTQFAIDASCRQKDYLSCWQQLGPQAKFS